MSGNVQIKITGGITQSIKKHIETNGGTIKNNNLSVWKQVMTEVNTAQKSITDFNANAANTDKKQNIFSGEGDVSKIGDKSSWANDFKVMAGEIIELAANVWENIVKLLTGTAPQVEETKKEDTSTTTTGDNSDNGNPVETNIPSDDSSKGTSGVPDTPSDNSGKGTPVVPTGDSVKLKSNEQLGNELLTALQKGSLHASTDTATVTPSSQKVVIPKDENTPRQIDQTSADGQRISMSYTLTDDENGFSCECEGTIQSMSKENYKAFKDANIDFLNSTTPELMILHGAIYDELKAKESNGEELTSAESKFIQKFEAAVEKCHLKYEKGNFKLNTKDGEPIPARLKFPNVKEAEYNENGSCTNLTEFLESYGCEIVETYDDSWHQETRYIIKNSQGEEISISKDYNDKNAIAEIIRFATYLPKTQYKL